MALPLVPVPALPPADPWELLLPQAAKAVSKTTAIPIPAIVDCRLMCAPYVKVLERWLSDSYVSPTWPIAHLIRSGPRRLSDWREAEGRKGTNVSCSSPCTTTEGPVYLPDHDQPRCSLRIASDRCTAADGLDGGAGLPAGCPPKGQFRIFVDHVPSPRRTAGCASWLGTRTRATQRRTVLPHYR